MSKEISRPSGALVDISKWENVKSMMTGELMDKLLWTEWFMLPPLPLSGVGPNSEPQQDVIQTKIVFSRSHNWSIPEESP